MVYFIIITAVYLACAAVQALRFLIQNNSSDGPGLQLAIAIVVGLGSPFGLGAHHVE